MDRWIKASRRTDQSPTSIVPRRGASELSQSAVPLAPRVTGVTQIRHTSVSRSLRRSYAVGAAADAAMCPVSSMAFRFERAFRGAQKMPYRSPRDT